MRKYETLELRAVDFRGAKYAAGNGYIPEKGCPIQRRTAKTHHFPYIYMGVYFMRVGLSEEGVVNLRIPKGYYSEDFRADKSIAASHNYDNTIIRKIKLYYE